MVNRVVLVGRLTKDPEIRFTSSQKAVSNFTLAVNRVQYNKNKENEADFINIVVWGRIAENVSKYVGKGSLVAVDGRIQTRNYDNAQGQKVYVTEVVAESVTFLDSRNSGPSVQDSGFSEPKNNNSVSHEATFDTNKDPFAEFGNSIDISEDDLPF